MQMVIKLNLNVIEIETGEAQLRDTKATGETDRAGTPGFSGSYGSPAGLSFINIHTTV